MKSYKELEDENLLLRSIVAEALQDAGSWRDRAQLVLSPKDAVAVPEDKLCAGCSHTLKYHTGLAGICCKVSCDCMKFV